MRNSLFRETKNSFVQFHQIFRKKLAFLKSLPIMLKRQAAAFDPGFPDHPDKKEERMKAQHHMDLTSGPITKKLIRFILPIWMTVLLQTLYNAADRAVVGLFAGNEALAAVGSTGPATTLLLGIANGLSVGANVVIANLRGARKEMEKQRAMYTAMLLSVLCGIVISAIGIPLSKPILRLMSSPEDVIDLATLYMQIIFLGIPVSLIYNFGAAILRAHGDTTRPMIILTITGLVNVGLNLLLVIVFHMSVAGVAIATITAQALSAVSVVWILFNPKGDFKLKFKDLKFHKQELGTIVRVGIPCGFNGAVFSLSNVILQSSVNTFGSIAIAGNAAADCITSLIYTIASAVYTGCVSFSGQCFGAAKYKRIDWLLLTASGLGGGAVAVCALICTLFPRQLLGIFAADPVVVEAGISKMLILCWAYILYVCAEALLGALRGMRQSTVPTLINAFALCLPRFLWVWFLFPFHRTMLMLYLCIPISYALDIIVQGWYYLYCRKKQDAALLKTTALESRDTTVS